MIKFILEVIFVLTFALIISAIIAVAVQIILTWFGIYLSYWKCLAIILVFKALFCDFKLGFRGHN